MMMTWLGRDLSVELYRAAIRFLLSLALIVPIGMIGWLVYHVPNPQRFSTSVTPTGKATAGLTPNVFAALSPDVWNVLVPGRTLTESMGLRESRWRLAGTFFSFPDSGQSICKAILDDATTNRQVLVAEGDQLDELEIVRIFSDHIVVRARGQQDILWLSFAGKSTAGETPHAPPSASDESQSVLEKSRFGTRVGERRWIMNRDALMAYCDELRQDPERIGKLYVSMKPNYTETGSIAGYRVNMVGEHEFFASAGLQEGDVVKKVNSLQMTSQARAEYFISEFLQGRLNAVVLDIEREGQPEKLIYLIR